MEAGCSVTNPTWWLDKLAGCGGYQEDTWSHVNMKYPTAHFSFHITGQGFTQDFQFGGEMCVESQTVIGILFYCKSLCKEMSLGGNQRFGGEGGGGGEIPASPPPPPPPCMKHCRIFLFVSSM